MRLPVSALDRKMLRDVLRLKGQVLATSLVMASGVATWVAMMSTQASLELSLDRYYQEYRFADVFAHLKRGPASLADRIAAIPGVARVEPRVVAEVNLDVEGFDEPATGRLVSVPDRTRPGLNDLSLRSGRYIAPGRADEVVVGEAFAGAHGLEAGDRLGAIINGRQRRLRIVGVALSPEYIYTLRGGDVFPDDRRFGILSSRPGRGRAGRSRDRPHAGHGGRGGRDPGQGAFHRIGAGFRAAAPGRLGPG